MRITELVAGPRCSGGDPPADVADAARLYAPALFRYCWSRLRDRHLAEDAVQETFLRACSRGDGEAIKSIGGWLFGTARRCCLEIGRRRARPADRAISLDGLSEPTAGEDRDAGERGIHAAEAGRDGQGIESLLDGLDDEERSLVYLKHVSGLKCREIADATGVPVGTVTSALARIYSKLRASLKEQG